MVVIGDQDRDRLDALRDRRDSLHPHLLEAHSVDDALDRIKKVARATGVMDDPAFRDRIPVIVDEVTTLCGPGELIDVVVTERGIAVNPRRTDLLAKLRGTSLPLNRARTAELLGGRYVCSRKPDPVPISGPAPHWDRAAADLRRTAGKV